MFDEKYNFLCPTEKSDVGTRQKKWLDYLWYYNKQSFRVAYLVKSSFFNKEMYKWLSIEEAVCPVDHRELLKNLNEQVIEFDSDDVAENYRNAKILFNVLSRTSIPFYLQDHNGRSPHIHIFYTNLKIEDFSRMCGIDVLKFKGVGLCREIGGKYTKKDKVYYASYFKSFDEIKPIEIIEDVQFPIIDLNKNGRK